MNENIMHFLSQCENEISSQFASIDSCETECTERILASFRKNSISYRHFTPTNGYGYDDIGREALCAVYCEVLGTEAAFVRPQIASGTHALALAMQSVLRPGDTLLCASGRPYDTLEEVIGLSGTPGQGSLKEYGIAYKQCDLLPDGSIDTDSVLKAIDPSVKMVHLQRSRGYAWRQALSVASINYITEKIHAIDPEICVFLDNCYGEFTHSEEPHVDMMAGSLIKNPGGGIAPTGGYVAGKRKYVDMAAYRFTSPGIGAEVGSYAASYRPFFQGLFMAPHTVAQALKTAVLAAKVFSKLGFEVSPAFDSDRNDIIQAIRFDTSDALITFIQTIQKYSPIDSEAVPEPWAMPGYQDPIIMAAGTFVAGASIELSADAPVRPPYTAYMQGSLTYSHGRIAVAHILDELGLIK